MTVASEEITPSLVRSLVAQQFPQWADLPVSPVDVQGWDNRTFRLGERMAVRLPSADGYSEGLVREERTLATLSSRLRLAIPRVVASGSPTAAFARPWSVREWIEGRTLAAIDASGRESAIRSVGDALAELHACDPTGGLWAGGTSAYRGCHVSVMGEQIHSSLPLLNGRLAERCQTLWQAAVTTVWAGPPVWVHGDVAPGNMLFDGRNQLTALIDFGQACVGDPACDLAFAWLSCSSDERAILQDRLELPKDAWLRGAAWAMWKALISSPEKVRATYGRSRDAVLHDAVELITR